MISPRRSYSIPLPGRAPLALGARTLVMGILNVTPDSFADAGQHFDADAAVERAHRMIDEGEAETVRRIFKMYAEGAGLTRIAKALNADQVPPPRARTGSW